MTRCLRWVATGLFTVVITALIVVVSAACAQDNLELEKIPKKVVDTLKARFPKAEIHTWTVEKEGGNVVYDIEFKQAGSKFEADVKEEGTILNWEKEIMTKDLPKAANDAVKKKYPKAVFKEIMEITEIKEGKEMRGGYEIVIETVDGKEIEVAVTAGGKILEDEDSGEENEVGRAK